MSADYYLACETCKKCYHIGQLGWKFFSFYSKEPDCMRGIGHFIDQHVLCEGDGIRLLNESRVDDFDRVEWPKEE